MPTATATLTPDDLLQLELPEGVKHFELSEGELIPMGYALALHELIKADVLRLLIRSEILVNSGITFAESMFTLRSDRARISDAAWVSNERFAQIPRDKHAIPIAPDIAIEIIPDSERQERAEKKLRDYLEAGVEVWQIFPSTWSVIVWQGNRGTRVTGDDAITSEKLVGFSVSVTELLRS